MSTLITSLFAAALLAQSPDSISLSGVVVDTAGKPVSDVEVVLWGRTLADGLAPTLAQTMTDVQGAFRLEIARQAPEGMGPRRFIWAYRPGRTVAAQEADLAENRPLPPVRLTLADPSPRTLTILGPDDRPIPGVRLAPVLYAFEGRDLFQTPDDRLERLTITSGADGVAKLPFFPATIEPIMVRVTAPGIVPHNLPVALRPGRDRVTVKLGRPARLAGTVYNDSGLPASNVPIELWAENTYSQPWVPDESQTAKYPPSLMHFDSGPIRTRADGTFLTPPQLLTGLSYRIIIRSEGGPLVSSDWLPATTELTTVPLLRLQRQRKLLGVVHNRQGRPIAGARVFLPAGKPSTTTDAKGRYLLEGVLPDRTYLLVKAAGFRFQGWPGIPAREPRERKLVLVRTIETPDRTMAAQPAPISFEESRALARRLLEPSLQAALAKGEDRPKWDCLRIASRMDPGRVLELLENHPLQNNGMDASIRKIVATEVFATDPAKSESIVNAIVTAESRAWACVSLAEALPDDERARKRKLLDFATVQANLPRVGEGGVDPRRRISRLGQVAAGWLSLGEVDKARPLIREGLQLIAVLPEPEDYHVNFLSTAARLEPDRVLSLIRDVKSNGRRRSYYAAVVESLANEHPAEAERVFQLIKGSSRSGWDDGPQIGLRLCRRLAKTDPERARRIIVGLKMPRDQACGWALLALGLADRDKPASRSALAESIEVIDQLLDSTGAVKPAPTGLVVANNPAAWILPIVEKVAPERVEELFWRAVALMPSDDMARQRGTADPRIAEAAILLARYDRQVADVFVTQATSSQSPTRIVYLPMVIRAKAGVDPRGAVAMMETLPPGGPDLQSGPNAMTNRARDELLIYLIEPSENHWKYVWSECGIPLDDKQFP
jgi:hypothetical protein